MMLLSRGLEALTSGAGCSIHSFWRAVALAGLSLALAAPAGAATASAIGRAPAGQVRFYQVADSEFDPYTKSPTTAQKEWMRAHYLRMSTWSTYFDSRVSWFPGAWAYKDSFAIKPDWPVFSQHPEWILRDAYGNMLFIDWGCANGTCPQYAADFGNQAFRNFWINEAKQLIAKGYKGLWVDDVNLEFRTSNRYGTAITPIDPRTGKTMTIANWRRYMAEFMEQLRAALPTAEIAHNAIWYAGSTSDPYVQRQVKAANYINLERGATDKGLTNGTGTFGFETFLNYVDFVHSTGGAVIMMDYGTTNTEREFGMASLLLTNDGRDMINTDQVAWSAPDRWWPGYSTHLGDSMGMRFKWQGLLRRDFQCGMVLANQPGSSTITARLPQSYTTIEGSVVSSVTLAARQARVLRTSQCEAGGGGGCHN